MLHFFDNHIKKKKKNPAGRAASFPLPHSGTMLCDEEYVIVYGVLYTLCIHLIWLLEDNDEPKCYSEGQYVK